MAAWEQQHDNAKTILINSSACPPVKSASEGVEISVGGVTTGTATTSLPDQDGHPTDPPRLSNSPSEEPVTIEEKSLPKIPEESTVILTSAEHLAVIQQQHQQQIQQQQQQQQRQQRSLSVVIMQPIQLLPKYLRLNKSDLDLTESCEQQEHMIVTTTAAAAMMAGSGVGGPGFTPPPRTQQSLVVKELQQRISPPAVSTTTQQEIWTMLQKDRRYMDRNIYVGEEEGEEDDDEDMIEDGGAGSGPPVEHDAATERNRNKRLKSPTVAKPISLLLEGQDQRDRGSSGGSSDQYNRAGSLRLQLPKKKKKNKTDQQEGTILDDDDYDDQDNDDEFINGACESKLHSFTTSLLN